MELSLPGQQDILKLRTGRPDLMGPFYGKLSGGLGLYISVRDGLIVNWLVKDRVGRILFGCPSCGTIHAYYASAVYDPTWTAGGGECCEKAMRGLFTSGELWRV